MSRRLSLLYFKEEVSADLQTEPLLMGLLDAATRQLSEKYQVGSDLSLFVSESGPTNLLGLIDIRSTRIPCFFV